MVFDGRNVSGPAIPKRLTFETSAVSFASAGLSERTLCVPYASRPWPWGRTDRCSSDRVEAVTPNSEWPNRPTICARRPCNGREDTEGI
jgi:hypothetical protein